MLVINSRRLTLGIFLLKNLGVVDHLYLFHIPFALKKTTDIYAIFSLENDKIFQGDKLIFISIHAEMK